MGATDANTTTSKHNHADIASPRNNYSESTSPLTTDQRRLYINNFRQRKSVRANYTIPFTDCVGNICPTSYIAGIPFRLRACALCVAWCMGQPGGLSPLVAWRWATSGSMSASASGWGLEGLPSASLSLLELLPW